MKWLHQLPAISNRSPGEEQSPTAREITPGGRTLQPDGVAINHPETRKDAAEEIGDQCGVEVPQVARTNEY